jgi:hypothetical protein
MFKVGGYQMGKKGLDFEDKWIVERQNKGIDDKR